MRRVWPRASTSCRTASVSREEEIARTGGDPTVTFTNNSIPFARRAEWGLPGGAPEPLPVGETHSRAERACKRFQSSVYLDLKGCAAGAARCAHLHSSEINNAVLRLYRGRVSIRLYQN